MKFEDCKKGIAVRISNNIEKSLKKHGSTLEKKRLAGSFQVIDQVKERNNAIVIKGWHFLAEDLNQIDIDIEQNDLKFKNISEVKEGMYIKISYDISDSCGKHGGGHSKQKLAGTLQTVAKVRPESNSVRVCHKNTQWHFSLHDIRKAIDPDPLKEPEFFNPNQLVLD